MYLPQQGRYIFAAATCFLLGQTGLYRPIIGPLRSFSGMGIIFLLNKLKKIILRPGLWTLPVSPVQIIHLK
jgi:hypothetical protein